MPPDSAFTYGPISQSAHQLDELWRELVHQDQATHERCDDVMGAFRLWGADAE